MAARKAVGRRSLRQSLIVVPAALLGIGMVCLPTQTAEAQNRRPKANAEEVTRRPFAAPDTPKQTERIRTFDVKHVLGELNVDLEKAELSGTVSHTLTPLFSGMSTVTFDCASGIKVSKVSVSVVDKPNTAADCKFEAKNEGLVVSLDRPYEPAETIKLAVTYSASSPKEGLYFIKPDATDKPGTPLCAWTQGEADETHHWLPCYDFPNDRATSEMIVTVAKPYFVLSNGVLVDTKDNSDQKTTTYHWKMDVPHVSYLIMLAISEFNVVHDKAGELSVDYYVLKSFDEAAAKRAMGKTPKMVDFFAKMTGRPYPYAKYAQVVVPEFTNGGMENITATTLNDYILSDDISYLEFESDGLIAHELAHQWFGDLLTCRDWPHLWLNEGFASYFDALFTEFDKGDDPFRLKMDGEFRSYAAGDRWVRRAIVEPRYSNLLSLFDGVTYAKGACILHALRGHLGDETWWKGIQAYVSAHQEQVVDSNDLKGSMEKASGKPLDWFFDQWVSKAGHPELKARWHYEDIDKTVRVHVEQTQKVDDQTPMFRLPTTLRIVDGAGSKTVNIVIDGPTHEFVIPFEHQPKTVRIDPEGWIPKELTWEKTPDEWIEQLSAEDALGRIEAARALAKDRERSKSVKAVADAIGKEKVIEAKVSLLRIASGLGEKVRPALIEAASDKSPKVRAAAFNALADGTTDATVEPLYRSVLTKPDEPYGVRNAALKGLAKGKSKDRDELIAKALQTKSHNDNIAVTALELLLDEKGAKGREAAVGYSGPGHSLPLRRAAIRKLESRADDDPEAAKALLALVNDPSRLVRTGIWGILGKNKIKGGLAALESQVKNESGKLKTRLENDLKSLKASANSEEADDTSSNASNSNEVKELERQASELELRARELRNQAEALMIGAEKAKLQRQKASKN